MDNSNNNKARLLSDKELKDEIIRIYNRADEASRHTVGLADDKYVAHFETIHTEVFNLINTQKRLYAESIIGEDEFLSSTCVFKNELRAEQRARIR